MFCTCYENNKGLKNMNIVCWLQQWSPIIVAIITGGASILVIFFTKWRELLMNQRKVKEEQYIEFLQALSLSLRKKEECYLENLTKTVQTIYLIGSAEVIHDMNEIIKLATDKGTLDSDLKNKQDEYYANLIKSMRKDLKNIRQYNSSKMLEKIPKKLNIWIFSRKNDN